MTYLRYFLGSAILVLTIAGGINFIVDPANIYREGRVTPITYIEALVRSKHGLYSKEGMFDERLLAKAVASKSFNADCIVIGSSHVMQISSERKSKALKNICDSILNLGVPGGTIEDHYTLAYLALQSRHNGRPNKIILGVDPWEFAFGKDLRWTAYSADYLIAKTEILNTGKVGVTRLSDTDVDETNKKKLANLINLEYTIRSIKAIVRGSPVIEAAPELDPSIGGDYAIRQWIISSVFEPILLMTPYHENVFKAPKSLNAIAIKATEPIVLNLAHELKIKVIGTYDPKMLGCLSNEFYDFMHPTAECLAKLRAR